MRNALPFLFAVVLAGCALCTSPLYPSCILTGAAIHAALPRPSGTLPEVIVHKPASDTVPVHQEVSK